MAERHPKDDLPILRFDDQQAWERWLEAEHASSRGVWLRTAKKAAAVRTVSHAEALDSALCFGWIDGQRLPEDETFFLQRFTPRRPRSNWSSRWPRSELVMKQCCR